MRSMQRLHLLPPEPFAGDGSLPQVDVDLVDDIVQLLRLVVVVLQRRHVLHARDVAVEAQQRGHGHLQQQREPGHHHNPPGAAVLRLLRTAEADEGGPDGHGEGIEIVGGVGEEEPEEGLVVPGADAVVEEAAVVVELFRTAVAAHAVVAVLVHLAVADEALPHHPRGVPRRQLLVQHHSVHRVLRGQVDVVVGHRHQQHEVESQHRPQDAIVDRGQRGDHQRRVAGQLCGEENEREDLLPRGGLGVGVDLFVGAEPALAGREVLLGRR